MAASSSRFAVAVHILVALGKRQSEGGGWMTSQDLASSVGTDPVVIRVLIRTLKESGFVETKEGKDGGIQLTSIASAITLGKVYKAVETGGTLTFNKRKVNPTCSVSRGMKQVLSPIFSEVEDVIADTLEKQTLGSLVVQVL